MSDSSGGLFSLGLRGCVHAVTVRAEPYFPGDGAGVTRVNLFEDSVGSPVFSDLPCGQLVAPTPTRKPKTTTE